MKIRMLQKVESAHQWPVDDPESDKVVMKTGVLRVPKDAVVDENHEDLQKMKCTDWPRWARKLVRMGFAEEVKE